MVNSRAKGADGERELSKKLNEYGYQTRRGQQYCGTAGNHDVIGLPGIAIECKRVQNLNINKAVEQIVRDAKEGELPAVFHRKNGTPWLVTMPINEWMLLYKEWEKNVQKESH